MHPSQPVEAVSAAEQQDMSPLHSLGQEAGAPDAPRTEARPVVGKLLARLFGGGAAKRTTPAFAATEWQATEWQDTRSPATGD